MVDASKVAVPSPDQLRKLAGDRRAQVIVGVALLGFGVGLYLGVKVRGPQRWVPAIERKRQPCPDCDERARVTVPLGVPVPTSQPIPPDVVTTSPPTGQPVPMPEGGGPLIGPQTIESPRSFSPHQSHD